MIEILVRNKTGDVIYAENAISFEQAEESLGRAERFVQKKYVELLDPVMIDL